jgi:hypothetical protein
MVGQSILADCPDGTAPQGIPRTFAKVIAKSRVVIDFRAGSPGHYLPEGSSVAYPAGTSSPLISECLRVREEVAKTDLSRSLTTDKLVITVMYSPQ